MESINRKINQTLSLSRQQESTRLVSYKNKKQSQLQTTTTTTTTTNVESTLNEPYGTKQYNKKMAHMAINRQKRRNNHKNQRSTIRTLLWTSCLVQVTTALILIPPTSLPLQRRAAATKTLPTVLNMATINKNALTDCVDSVSYHHDNDKVVDIPTTHHAKPHAALSHNGHSLHQNSQVLLHHNGHDLHRNGKKQAKDHDNAESNHARTTSTRNQQLVSLNEYSTRSFLSSHDKEAPSEPLSAVEDAIATALTGTLSTMSSKQMESTPPETSKSKSRSRPWKRRHARSIQEGIRRETTTQLSTLLTEKHNPVTSKRHYVARTITGLVKALTEEADGLEVEVQSRSDTPFWRKQVDSVQIRFSRLGIQPLRMGGLNDAIQHLETSATIHMTQELQLSTVLCADEAFRRIDADQSGALDGKEIAQALNLAASTDSDAELLQGLASKLVGLYDLNGDGVIDRGEYQLMVEDMATLRHIQQERGIQRLKVEQPSFQKKLEHLLMYPLQTILGKIANKTDTTKNSIKVKESSLLSTNSTNDEPDLPGESSALIDAITKGSGTITFSNMKLDLRRLVFGAIPLLKRITPGGPLILEPFTATLIGSFNKDDVMESYLLDAGLRRLVARALRRRVRSFRDLVDGAVFFGRDWNMASQRAPQVEVAKLTSMEFDLQDRMVITGRVRIRTSPDSPVIENAFKVRTKIGTRKDGQVIRLVEPELALVAECPKGWERNIVSACKKLNLPVPVRPEPLYAFFPIYSPFKVEDNDGFDMGEDNCLKSIYIKDGALRFEMRCVLRPGRFLGNHYIAFSFPNRTFIITMDRVRAGIRAARKNKRAALAAQAANKKRQGNVYQASIAQSISKHPQLDTTKEDLAFVDPNGLLPTKRSNSPKTKKSFFSRFVEGYLGVTKDNEVRNQMLTMAISDWFGRQGLNSTNPLES